MWFVQSACLRTRRNRTNCVVGVTYFAIVRLQGQVAAPSHRHSTFCGLIGSKTCQKEAWSSGLVPHRSICKDIAKLVEVWEKTTAETKRIVDVRSPEWDRDFSQISANFNLHLCILAAEQGIDKEGLARVLVQLQRFNADMGMGDSK